MYETYYEVTLDNGTCMAYESSYETAKKVFDLCKEIYRLTNEKGVALFKVGEKYELMEEY